MEKHSTSNILTLSSRTAVVAGAGTPTGKNQDVEFFVEPLSEYFVRFDEVELEVVSFFCEAKNDGISHFHGPVYVSTDLAHRTTKSAHSKGGVPNSESAFLTNCIAIAEPYYNGQTANGSNRAVYKMQKSFPVCVPSPFGRSLRVRLTDVAAQPIKNASLGTEDFFPWTLVVKVTPKYLKQQSDAMSM